MKISQREARRLRKRVSELEGAIEKQRRIWGQEYVGGVHLMPLTFSESCHLPAVVKAARKMGHAVVVTGDDGQTLNFYALPLPKER